MAMSRALTASFLLFARATSSAEGDCEADGDAMAMLHMSVKKTATKNAGVSIFKDPDVVAKHLRETAADPPFFGAQREALHPHGSASADDAAKQCGSEKALLPKNTRRPMNLVLKEHPGMNATCYWMGMGKWLDQAQESYVARDFHATPMSLRATGLDLLQRKPTDGKSWKNVSYDGGFFGTMNRADKDMAHDWFCHANGWAKSSAADVAKVRDFEFWQKRADSECAKLRSEFPEHASFTMNGPDPRNHSKTWMEPVTMFKEFNGKRGPAPPQQMARLQAAWKCEVGTLAVDMAHCVTNWCELSGGYMGHSTECPQA